MGPVSSVNDNFVLTPKPAIIMCKFIAHLTNKEGQNSYTTASRDPDRPLGRTDERLCHITANRTRQRILTCAKPSIGLPGANCSREKTLYWTYN